MKRNAAVTARHGRRGVTLLELSIALAVVAVLGALALPAVDKRMARQRLVTAAESMLADLTEARFLAVRQARAVTLLVHPGSAWRWQVQHGPAGAAAVDSSGAQALGDIVSTTLHTGHPGVRMPRGHSAQLLGDGTAKATTVAVFESLHGESLQVDLLALGRSRICHAGIGSATPRVAVLQRYPLC